MTARSLALGVMIASALLAAATPAAAQTNFIQGFLNRYRAPAAQSTVFSTASVADPAIEALIRDGVLALTVEDVIRLMLESSLDVRVQRYSPLASQYAIDSAMARFEPSLRISTSMNRSTSPTRSQLDGAAAVSQLGHNFSIGLQQLLSTGAAVSVDFSVNRSSSNSVFNTFNPSYSGSLRYSVTQPLLRGRGSAITRRPIQVAQNNREMTEIQFEMNLINMVTQAQLLYWDLVFAQEDLQVRQRSLELAEKTRADNLKQVEVGTLARIELLQAEAQVASREEQLVSASYGYDQLQDRMKLSITHLADPALVLARLVPIESVRRPNPADVMPVEAAIRYALESRPEMRQSELELENRSMEVQFARNQLLPSIDVTASFNQSGIGGVETIRSGLGDNAVVEVRNGGVGNALQQIFGYDFTGYSVGISVSIPLGNKAAQAQYATVLTQQQTAQSRRAALEQSIALEVRQAHSQVEMNRVRLEAAERALELAALQLSAEERKHQLGVSPVRFVLDEQRNLAAAQTSELQALINYTKALVQYDRAIGRTLDRNRIEVDVAARMP